MSSLKQDADVVMFVWQIDDDDGRPTWLNYAGACESCNGKKGAMPLLEFLGRRAGMVFPVKATIARQAA